MMNVVGICGSPRVGGNSEWMLRKTLEVFNDSQFKKEIILLSKEKIEFCDGCLACEDIRKCPIHDGMENINPQLKNADLIVFSTPAYFDNVTGKLKNFIDRMNLIGPDLKGKMVGTIVVGQADETSWENVINYLKTFCEILDMKFIGSISMGARAKSEIQKSDNAEKVCRDFGKKLISSLNTP